MSYLTMQGKKGLYLLAKRLQWSLSLALKFLFAYAIIQFEHISQKAATGIEQTCSQVLKKSSILSANRVVHHSEH